jgi:tetratricopeptide (TPR) repeat protein
VAKQTCWERNLCIAVAILLVGPPLRAASLVCRFSDEQGKVLSNVETQLTRDGSEKHLSQKSNKKGEAIFHDLTPGAFELRAQLKNHMPLKWSVQFSQEQTLELTLMTQDSFDRIDKEAADEINGAQFPKAAATLENLLKTYPMDAELHDHLALAYAGMGDEGKALAQGKEAAQLDPQFSDSPGGAERLLLLVRGDDALQNQDFPKAEEALASLVKIAPQDAKAYYGLALAYGHQEKFQLALPAINRAVELDPQNATYRQVKAVLEAHAAGH